LADRSHPKVNLLESVYWQKSSSPVELTIAAELGEALKFIFSSDNEVFKIWLCNILKYSTHVLILYTVKQKLLPKNFKSANSDG